MKTVSRNITVSKTARYFMTGCKPAKVKTVWFVLHGYGQLASDFIKDFESLAGNSTLIIAPEALNKFYLRSFTGKIGAAWMTKEDRENEIIDYVNYLDSVYIDVLSRIPRKKIKIAVLGFSQGTATACRWLTLGDARADRLILWGGVISPDIDLVKYGDLLNSMNLTIVIGKNDKIVSEEQLKIELRKLEENLINFSFERFDGGHELNADQLMKYFSD
jgi:predicted esterase